jgi:hypothetical protein
MPHRAARLEYLIQSLSELKDDLSLPWQTYPCLEWPYYRERKMGYGIIAVHLASKHIRVHRYACEFAYGPLAADMEACHRCDHPPCYRPSHLFAATQAGNLEDMYQKGRANVTGPRLKMRGAGNHKARLTPEQVEEIRNTWVYRVNSQEKLARKFGVGQSMISAIVLGKSWKP